MHETGSHFKIIFDVFNFDAEGPSDETWQHKAYIKLTEGMQNDVKSHIKTIHNSIPIESISAEQITNCEISCKIMR